MAVDPETGELHKTQERSRAQRVREALVQRDWAGILIELIVVTLGVLLAFRVEQWGQQRNRAIEEGEFLERLYRENARSISELRDASAVHHATVEQLATVIRGRDNVPLLRRLSLTKNYGCWLMTMPAVSFNITASEELIASGRLNLISDANLRAELRELAAAQVTSAQQLDFSRRVTQLFAPYLHEKQELSLGPGPSEICYMDWLDVVSERGSYNAVVRTYRAHSLMAQSRRDLLGKAERAQRALACKLNKPECAS